MDRPVKEKVLTKRERHNETQRAWRAANRPSWLAYRRAWHGKNRDRVNAARRLKSGGYARNLRMEVIAAYGGECACCQETHYEFLTIDHIYGDGASERRTTGKRSMQQLYLYLRRNGYPKDRYRLLCMNCNWARGKYGYCPHDKGAKCPEIQNPESH